MTLIPTRAVAATLLLAIAQLPLSPAFEAAAEEVTPKSNAEQERRWAGRWGRRNPDTEGEWERPVERVVDDPYTARRLGEALRLLQEERYDEAHGELDRLRPRSLNEFEKARSLQIRAYISFAQGDLSRARDGLKEALALNALLPDGQAEVRYQIAQLYLAEESWGDVIDQLGLWFEMVDTPNPVAYYLLALAHFQQEDMEGALAPARQSVELTEAPLESWLQILLAILVNRKEYAEAVPVLEALVRQYPNKRYWVTLSTLHASLGSYEEALVPLQMAYDQGMLTQNSEFRRLAQLLSYVALPYRAAKVMQKALEDGSVTPDVEAYQMLGNSWIAAREYDRAVAPLVQAAELSEDGALFVRLARVHIQRERWSEAADALGRGIERGGLENPGEAELMMGIAVYNQGNASRARSWFTRAGRHEMSRKEAGRWIEHIDREVHAAS